MSHTKLNYAGRIREGGYRLTPQRQIILDALCELGGHVPVPVLVDAVQRVAPAIDRATVYRSLGLFADLGLVVTSDIDGVTVVEISPDGTTGHSHLVCRGCGEIQHVPASVFDSLERQLQSDYGFSAELDNLTLDGLCRECDGAVPA